tara:strand:- start:5409 stop:5780 length:372 start_codon:yes stop_codon:yes gene_type:complete
MTVDNETPNKGKTTAKIEQVDESWALKLLNESEQDDYFIKVEDELIHHDFYPKELSLISDTNTQDSDDGHIEVTDHQQTKSPSAIENQIWVQAQKLRNNKTETITRQQKLNASFLRIKSFFVA